MKQFLHLNKVPVLNSSALESWHQDALRLQTFLGLGMVLGTLGFGCIVVNRSKQCLISPQYLLQTSILGIGKTQDMLVVMMEGFCICNGLPPLPNACYWTVFLFPKAKHIPHPGVKTWWGENWPVKHPTKSRAKNLRKCLILKLAHLRLKTLRLTNVDNIVCDHHESVWLIIETSG